MHAFREKIQLTPKKRKRPDVPTLAGAERIMTELDAAKLTFINSVGGPGGGLALIKDVLFFKDCLGEPGVKAVGELVYVDHVDVHSQLQLICPFGTVGHPWVGQSAGFLKLFIKGQSVAAAQRNQRVFKEASGYAENLRIVYSAWSTWSTLEITTWLCFWSFSSDCSSKPYPRVHRRIEVGNHSGMV